MAFEPIFAAYSMAYNVTDNTARPGTPRDTTKGAPSFAALRRVGMCKSVLVTTLAVASMALASTSLATDGGTVDLVALQAKDPSTSIQRLYEQCTGTNVREMEFCTGYIIGVAETLGQNGLHKSTRGQSVCWQGLSIDYAAAVQVFKNWAQKHPEAWGLPRYGGVMWALKETWPCK